MAKKTTPRHFIVHNRLRGLLAHLFFDIGELGLERAQATLIDVFYDEHWQQSIEHAVEDALKYAKEHDNG